MKTSTRLAALAAFATLCAVPALAQQPTSPPQPPSTPSAPFDEALAQRLGADDYGMKRYVLVILKNGPNRMAEGPERDEMFRGHFANMKRLAAEGKLIQAGPLDGVDGWRGLFVFAVADVEEAKQLAATDPVLLKGEMIAEYHRYYGSAALMLVNETHERVAKKRF